VVAPATDEPLAAARRGRRALLLGDDLGEHV
jgi:hypothetical protein